MLLEPSAAVYLPVLFSKCRGACVKCGVLAALLTETNGNLKSGNVTCIVSNIISNLSISVGKGWRRSYNVQNRSVVS